MKTLAVGNQHTQVLNRTGSLRSRDNCLRRIPTPNVFDACLGNEMCMWEEIVGMGLTKICCPMGRRKYPTRPWVQMPAEGRQFKPVGVSGIISTLALDTNVPVLTVQVPTGYDGVITDYVCEVAASSGGAASGGFVEGSGQVVWRLAADGRYLRDLGDIQVTMGSLIQPSPVPRGGLRVFSKNVITFYVDIASATVGFLDPNARIVCSISGWFWAR